MGTLAETAPRSGKGRARTKPRAKAKVRALRVAREKVKAKVLRNAREKVKASTEASTALVQRQALKIGGKNTILGGRVATGTIRCSATTAGGAFRLRRLPHSSNPKKRRQACSTSMSAP